MSGENFEITSGSALDIVVNLLDDDGATISAYDGSQPLSVVVWPGGNRAVAFNPAASWTAVSPNPNVVTITITSAQSATLSPGRHHLLARLQDGSDWVDFYSCTLDVTAVSGTEAAPKTYPADASQAYANLLKYGRSWLNQLRDPADESEFDAQLGAARDWLDSLAQSHHVVGWLPMCIEGAGYGYGPGYGSGLTGGPWDSGASSDWLQSLLDADALIVTPAVAECVAMRALYEITRSQVDGDPQSRYARLARMYRSQSEYLASCLRLEVDSDGDGVGDYVIDLSCSKPRYG